VQSTTSCSDQGFRSPSRGGGGGGGGGGKVEGGARSFQREANFTGLEHFISVQSVKF
jgi:hypothetical protein